MSSGELLWETELKLADAIKARDIDRFRISHGLLQVARMRMDGATNAKLNSADKSKHVAV